MKYLLNEWREHPVNRKAHYVKYDHGDWFETLCGEWLPERDFMATEGDTPRCKRCQTLLGKQSNHDHPS